MNTKLLTINFARLYRVLPSVADGYAGMHPRLAADAILSLTCVCVCVCVPDTGPSPSGVGGPRLIAGITYIALRSLGERLKD